MLPFFFKKGTHSKRIRWRSIRGICEVICKLERVTHYCVLKRTGSRNRWWRGWDMWWPWYKNVIYRRDHLEITRSTRDRGSPRDLKITQGSRDHPEITRSTGDHKITQRSPRFYETTQRSRSCIQLRTSQLWTPPRFHRKSTRCKLRRYQGTIFYNGDVCPRNDKDKRIDVLVFLGLID